MGLILFNAHAHALNKLQKSNESIPKLAIFEGSRYSYNSGGVEFNAIKRTVKSRQGTSKMHVNALMDRSKALRVETWKPKDVLRFLGRGRWDSPFLGYFVYIYILQYIYSFFL